MMLPTPSRREAPAARDVDDAAPLVAAEGRLAATWAPGPLALVSGIKEAEPHLVKQLLYSGIVKDLGFT